MLVPGGVLGVMWGGPDRESPFFAQAQSLLGGEGPSPVGEHECALASAVNDPFGADQVLEIPAGLPFDQPEMRAFTWNEALTADDLVGLLGTFSWVILMEEEARLDLLRRPAAYWPTRSASKGTSPSRWVTAAKCGVPAGTTEMATVARVGRHSPGAASVRCPSAQTERPAPCPRRFPEFSLQFG